MTQTVETQTATDIIDKAIEMIEKRGFESTDYSYNTPGRTLGESPVTIPHALYIAETGYDPEAGHVEYLKALFAPPTEADWAVENAVQDLTGGYADWTVGKTQEDALAILRQAREVVAK